VNRLTIPIDVLIVGRGGGSLEDLWCFNEEVLLRAVAASRIPTVSAVGHEIDVTLCDFVADVRALTPSEAAELVVPQFEAIGQLLEERRRRMHTTLLNRVTVARRRLSQLGERRMFRRPHEMSRDRSQRLDELWLRAGRAAKNRLERDRGRLRAVAGKLESLSPLEVLGRGYSVTVRADDGLLVADAADVAPGDRLRTRVARGEIISRVETVRVVEHPPVVGVSANLLEKSETETAS